MIEQKWQRFGYFGVIVRCSSIHIGLVQKGEKKERMRRKTRKERKGEKVHTKSVMIYVYACIKEYVRI